MKNQRPFNKSVFSLFESQQIRRWLLAGISMMALGVFFKVSFELHEGNSRIGLVDRDILLWMETLRSGVLNAVAVDLTALGSAVIVTMLSILFSVCFAMGRDWGAVLHLLLASIGAYGWSALLKGSFGRARPELIPRLVEVAGFSYPSGHSLAASALYTTFALLGCRYYKGFRQRIVLFSMSTLIVGLVAISRVYLGVHYPSDTLSGVSFGMAWAFLLAVVLRASHINSSGI